MATKQDVVRDKSEKKAEKFIPLAVEFNKVRAFSPEAEG